MTFTRFRRILLSEGYSEAMILMLWECPCCKHRRHERTSEQVRETCVRYRETHGGQNPEAVLH